MRKLFQAIKNQFIKKWSIGIYKGDTPFKVKEYQKNPIIYPKKISDLLADFVADPFIVYKKEKFYIFFEVLDSKPSKGLIGLTTSPNGLDWNYKGIVLEEKFHLSYPLVFSWEEDFFMIPETYQANAIRLYKAKNFPREWKFVMDLKVGEPYVDSTMFHHNGKWWLYTTVLNSNRLRLFYSDELRTSNWIEHPSSPIIKGRFSRPGGRVLTSDDRVIRFCQDLKPTYGSRVVPFEIERLSTSSYQERKLDTFLSPSGKGWNGARMHHVDFCRTKSKNWIIVTDGFSERLDIDGVDRTRVGIYNIKHILNHLVNNNDDS